MRVADYLRVPYVTAVTSADRGDGEWQCVVECPELPDCTAASTSILDALDDLARTRVTVILDVLRRGEVPPVPRPPLTAFDLERELDELGLLSEVAPFLSKDGAAMAETHTPDLDHTP